MELVEVSPEAYATAFPITSTPYGSVAFNQLNAGKVESLYFIGLKDGNDRFRAGMILGRKGKELHCPFSAPFGELSCNGRQKLETVSIFFKCLKERFDDFEIHLTLPPSIYCPGVQPKASAILANVGHQAYADLNYHYDLSDFTNFKSSLDSNARNHFNRSLRAGFVFGKCSLKEAYPIIAENRSERGYPLRMSLAQLSETSEIINIDSFRLTLEGENAAAAIVYRLSADIAQVIYWGHLEKYSNLRPMNLLAHEIFGFYASLGMKIVDIGPASSDGVPDMGLCTFKESIGCRLTFKPTFIIK